MAKEIVIESKSVLEKAILEYKQILEVAKTQLAENHTKELEETITKLIKENDISLYKEPEMVKEESLSTETTPEESANAGEAPIDMKEATMKEIEEAFDAASDEDEFKVVKTDDQNNDGFSLDDIQGEIQEVMSEIEAAENVQQVEQPEEEDTLTKFKKIHEEMGQMIEAMDTEKNELTMKENFHGKMMETFGEGYENSIGVNECNKMYETFKMKSMNETEASMKAPKASAVAPSVKPVVAENESTSAGKSNVPKTFTPNAAAKSGSYAAKPVVKPLDKAVMEMETPVEETPVEETHGVGLSVNKLVSGNQTPSIENKDYAKDKVRLALQKEGSEKLQKRINSLVKENFELTKKSNKANESVKEMTKINESYREAIDKYRKQLNEMALVSTNIANVNNILVNESLALSFEDKKNIINEFKQVSTVEESDKTYKKLIKGYSESKKTIKESVEQKLNSSSIEASSSKEVSNNVGGTALNEHVEKLKKLSTYKSKN